MGIDTEGLQHQRCPKERMLNWPYLMGGVLCAGLMMKHIITFSSLTLLPGIFGELFGALEWSLVFPKDVRTHFTSILLGHLFKNVKRVLRFHISHAFFWVRWKLESRTPKSLHEQRSVRP